MENMEPVRCKEWQEGNLVQNQSFAAGESWVGGAAGIQHRAKLLFVEVPRYLRTLWLAFYFLRQPQHFRSQTKQTLNHPNPTQACKANKHESTQTNPTPAYWEFGVDLLTISY